VTLHGTFEHRVEASNRSENLHCDDIDINGVLSAAHPKDKTNPTYEHIVALQRLDLERQGIERPAPPTSDPSPFRA